MSNVGSLKSRCSSVDRMLEAHISARNGSLGHLPESSNQSYLLEPPGDWDVVRGLIEEVVNVLEGSAA